MENTDIDSLVWRPLDPTNICPSNANISACTNFGINFLRLLTLLYGGSEDVRKQKKLQKCNEKGDEDIIKKEFDYIVIGCGSAGSIVASRLSENKNWSVKILEAGPEQPDISFVPGLTTSMYGSNIDWNYKTKPNGKSCLALDGKCPWPRGKVMGGSSTLNSMTYIVGNKHDYDDWAAMGNKGWSYKDVLPFFKKFEKNMNIKNLSSKYHGVDGLQPVSWWSYVDEASIMLTKAFNEGGLPIRDFNGKHQFGTMQAQNTAKDGLRQSTNTAFIQPFRYKRKNLTVSPNSEAIKILFDKHKRAYGVQYKKNGKVHTVVAKKEIIVSAGAINSPKLLLLSGIGPKEDLKRMNINVVKDLPVGHNLHDHVTFNGLMLRLPKEIAAAVSNEEIINSVLEFKYQKKKNGPLAADGPVNSIAFYKTNPKLKAPDIQVQCNAVNVDECKRNVVIYNSLIYYPTCFYTGIMVRPMYLIPKSRGKLYLNSSDPHGAPILDVNYFDDSRDLESLIKGAQLLLKLEDTDAFTCKKAVWDKTPLSACKDMTWGSVEYLKCLATSYTATTYHVAGTCKMGSDGTAVVDQSLKVYGVTGLRVVDASIMPKVTRGNTNAPSMMIGEKGADLIKKYWKYKENC